MLYSLIKAFKIIFRFITVSFWTMSLLLLALFLTDSPKATYVTAFLYRLSIPVYYYLILLIISIILSPLYLNKYSKYLILLPKILFDSFLLADYFVFKIYRFHIDMMFIKMTISDFKGIGMSPLIVILAILAIVIIGFINYKIFRWAEKHRIVFPKTILTALLLFFVTGQAIHIWANYHQQVFITQYTPYVPYYFPTTSHHLMKKWTKKAPFWLPKPFEKPSEGLQLHGRTSANALFDFPKSELHTDSLQSKPNILIFVLESWRADHLNPQVTPVMDSLSKTWWHFKHHTSSGNVTVSGIFGLLYGLHSTYLSYAQANPEQYPSVLNQILKRQKYNIGVYTSSNLDRFSLKAIMFPGIDKKHYINFLSGRADKKDRKVINHLVADIKSDSQNPWFKFVFLTSSHHYYFYPDTYKIFKPVPKNSEGFIFDKDIDAQPFINDYNNSLRYEDDLFKEVITALKQSGEYDNTLIFVTGDHGEEFNDNQEAYWGHGSNFTKYQTAVPLFVHLPHQKVAKQIEQPTNHIDIVPSILKQYLGVSNPVSDFSSGKNMFGSIPNRGFILTSYKDKAYIINDTVYSTGLFVKSYLYDDIKKVNKKYNYKGLNKLRKEENRFIKSSK